MSNGKKKKMKRMACAAAAGMMSMSFIMPAFAQDEAITPKKADYGYYVEEYQKNGDTVSKILCRIRQSVSFLKCLTILHRVRHGITVQF